MALSLMYANNVHQIIRRRQQCGGFTDLRPSIEQQRSAIIVIIKIGLDLFAASLTPLSSPSFANSFSRNQSPSAIDLQPE